MSYKEITIDWLEKIIVPAVDSFYSTTLDRDLIERDASERAITANLYCKMNRLLHSVQEGNDILHHLNIDVEYNRNYLDPKKVYEKCHACSQQSCFIKENGFTVTNSPPIF